MDPDTPPWKYKNLHSRCKEGKYTSQPPVHDVFGFLTGQLKNAVFSKRLHMGANNALMVKVTLCLEHQKVYREGVLKNPQKMQMLFTKHRVDTARQSQRQCPVYSSMPACVFDSRQICTNMWNSQYLTICLRRL